MATTREKRNVALKLSATSSSACSSVNITFNAVIHFTIIKDDQASSKLAQIQDEQFNHEVSSVI